MKPSRNLLVQARESIRQKASKQVIRKEDLGGLKRQIIQQVT